MEWWWLVSLLRRVLNIVRKYKNSSKNIKDFLNEVLSMQNLKHPNLVQLKEFYIESKHFYILMEYVEGETFKNYMKGNFLDEKEKLIIVKVFKKNKFIQ